jgi:hypothetical protein
VLKEAQSDVVGASRKAAVFSQNVIRGDERAGALTKFLKDRLPDAFATCKGEAIDYRDHRSTQLDLMVYHKQSCVPVSKQEENMLVPCEGLYSAIEVKSILTKDELEAAFFAAKRLRTLRPFKGKFVSSRPGGKAAEKGESRCMYILFAYTSNLGVDGWLQKEFKRVRGAAAAARTTVDVIDRIFVVDRGIINPGGAAGKAVDGHDDFMFVEFYLNLVNFIHRELRRRQPIDWQLYSARSSKRWVALQ